MIELWKMTMPDSVDSCDGIVSVRKSKYYELLKSVRALNEAHMKATMHSVLKEYGLTSDLWRETYRAENCK